MGLIYKYTNKINGKIYIGQTTTTLEVRDKKHLSQLSDHTYFHRALRKYGRDNFSLEIIEDDISSQEELDNREKYWIKIFDSYYHSEKGYNLTLGGQQWGNNEGILTGKNAEEIKNKIKNTKKLFLKQEKNMELVYTALVILTEEKLFLIKLLVIHLETAPNVLISMLIILI